MTKKSMQWIMALTKLSSVTVQKLTGNANLKPTRFISTTCYWRTRIPFCQINIHAHITYSHLWRRKEKANNEPSADLSWRKTIAISTSLRDEVAEGCNRCHHSAYCYHLPRVSLDLAYYSCQCFTHICYLCIVHILSRMLLHYSQLV